MIKIKGRTKNITLNAIYINGNYIIGVSNEDVNSILNYHLAQNREEQIKTVLDD
jgi:hypothetical protein